MAQDLNNALGFTSKYNQSYFRSWGFGGINAGCVYGVADPSFSEVVGKALTVTSNDATNGTRITVNEAGLYFTTFTIRTAATTAVSVGRFVKSDISSATLQNGTKDEVAFVNVTAAGTRFPASGLVYMLPGDSFLMISSVNTSISGFTWQICKISPTL